MAKRISLLVQRPETQAAKRDVEQQRLDRIRELEAQLLFQASEKNDIIAENNRLRVDLTRIQRRVQVYERHYETEKRPPLDLQLHENAPEVVEFPKGKPN